MGKGLKGQECLYVHTDQDSTNYDENVKMTVTDADGDEVPYNQVCTADEYDYDEEDDGENEVGGGN